PVASARHEAFVLLRAEPLWHRMASGGRLIVGGNDGGVRCLDAANGRIRWVFDAGAAVRCQPIAAQRRVDGVQRELIIVATDDDRVYAVDAYDGSEVCRFRTKGAAGAGNAL